MEPGLSESEYRSKQIDLLNRDLNIKEADHARQRISTPLFVAIVAASIGIFGNIGASLLNAHHERQLASQSSDAQLAIERERLYGGLITEVMKTGDSDGALRNYQFLFESELLPKSRYVALHKYVEKAVREGTPVAFLPAAENSSRILGCGSVADASRQIEQILSKAPEDATRWLGIAFREIGVCERTEEGARRVSEYLDSYGVDPARFGIVQTPWSSAFVWWVLMRAGLEEQRKDGPEISKRGIATKSPQIGDIIFVRSGPDRRFTLTGFYLGEQDGKVLVLAGNVANSVRFITYEPSRIIEYRKAALP